MKHTIKTISNEYLMSCTYALTFPLFHLSTLTQLPILNTLSLQLYIYIYDYITNLCRQQAEVIQNDENANVLNT
jgi:hypothetical protein